MKMQFLPELAAYLKEHSYIYTVRKFYYSSPDDLVEVEGVGTCKRVYISQINNKEALIGYIYASGFKSVGDWWKEIKRLNRGYVGPFYVYEVTVVKTLFIDEYRTKLAPEVEKYIRSQMTKRRLGQSDAPKQEKE